MSAGPTQDWINESIEGIIKTLFEEVLLSDTYTVPGETEVDLSGHIPLYPVIDQGMLNLQNLFNPFVLFLATLGILMSTIRLLWQRRLDPMLDLVRGLLTVIITTFAGIFFIHLLMGFSRALAAMIVDQGGGRESFIDSAGSVYASIMQVGLAGSESGFATQAAGESVTYIVGLAVVLGLIAQLVILVLLQAVIYLIACILPLAAASTMVPGLRIFPKVIGWLVACLLYKPLILLMYLAGLVILSGSGDDLFRYFVGAAIMLLATGALPVLMKLMSHTGVLMMAGAMGAGSAALGGHGDGGGGGGGGDAGGGAQGGNAQNTGGGQQAENSGNSQAQAAVQRSGALSNNLPSPDTPQSDSAPADGAFQAGPLGVAAGSAGAGGAVQAAGAGAGAGTDAAGGLETTAASELTTGADTETTVSTAPSGVTDAGGGDAGAPGAAEPGGDSAAAGMAEPAVDTPAGADGGTGAQAEASQPAAPGASGADGARGV
ncbi:hypothetical protein [Streptomonospora litoralis]|uniref:TrbL/VirB6 plasmid conjugal transfer protein n=1 Tax=Streptomonospora litoralis TaxID=2498135 RepID=A0A4P6Q9M8_9ACTN|nr:hypothetical protein [Streptomonospora litoralis]QBI56341.1 hypothetical protein EKD16_22940 [Streptomonospora litoralis]